MESVTGLWPWVLGLLCLPGLILGAPSASSCPGTCYTNSPEENQESWDKDIPAINQGLIPEETPENGFLLEGDIIRPSPFQLFSAASNKWPKSGNGLVEIPFLLSSEYNELSREVIMKAFAEFERLTCIRFVPYEGQRDFISIVPMSGCFSNVGRSGGMQVVSLAPPCLQKGPGIVLHELMHVLGFWHEHARADRDRYIRVNWNEILPGYEMNFLKARSSNMLVPYDYSSVMHYGRLAFSRRGIPTILPLWDPSIHIGQRWNLSALDITRVLRFYNCRPSGHDSLGRGGGESCGPIRTSSSGTPWLAGGGRGRSQPSDAACFLRLLRPTELAGVGKDSGKGFGTFSPVPCRPASPVRLSTPIGSLVLFYGGSGGPRDSGAA
ncbi:astacin-like metalloendopeptidase [Rhynchocyon petersi]